MNNKLKLSRRNFLKTSMSAGVGAGIASMVPLSSAQASGVDDNTKFIFINFSDGYPRGKWHPSGSNGNLSMNECTRDLDAYKDNIVFFENIATNGGSGHDGFRNLWRENQNQNSIDIEMQSQFSSGLPRGILRLGVDSHYYGHGSRQPSIIAGSTSGVSHEDNPQVVYNSLFAPIFASPGEAQQKANRDRAKIDILSQSIEDVRLLRGNLGGVEASKLTAFEQASLNARTELQNSLDSSVGTCSDLFNGSSSGRDLRADLQVANVAMALACGQTRVVSLQLGTTNDSKNVEVISNSTSPHDESHKRSALNIEHRRWYLSKITKIIEHLKLQPDVNGNMFDNTMIFVTSEMDDGSDHSSNNLPVMLIGGKNTRLETQEGGKIFRMPTRTPIGRLLRTYADAYGLNHPYSGTSIPGVFS
ncbi:DUF1552 domain-containing protein [Vibrio sp.]|nr:DUF1552 domain-containing protein [Vibrio sp.]